MTKPSTHEQHAKQFEKPYEEPPKQTEPTTHDIEMSKYTDRWVDRFHTDPTLKEISDILTSTSDEKRNAIKRALSEETK